MPTASSRGYSSEGGQTGNEGVQRSSSKFPSKTRDGDLPLPLRDIAAEAKKLAANSRASDDCCSSSIESKQKATEAARRLLCITQSFQESSLADPAQLSHVKTLHKSLMDVAAWNLSVLPSVDGVSRREEEERDFETTRECLTVAVELGRRSFELSLPFHFPLYESFLNTLALLDMTPGVADNMLEISSWATIALDSPMEADFFGQSLETLISRQRYDQAVILLSGMKARHNIDLLEYDFAVHLMIALKDSLEQDETNFYSNLDVESLSNLLEGEVIRALEADGVFEAFEKDAFSQRLQLAGNADVSEKEEDDEDMSDNEEDHSSKREDEKESAAAEGDQIIQAGLPKRVSGIIIRDGSGARNKDQSLAFAVVIVQKDKPDELVEMNAADLIYEQYASDFHLPDIWNQLEAQVDGKTLKFTESYENDLLERMYTYDEEVRDDKD